MAKMAAPFEVLDHLELPVTTIITDTALVWAIEAANRRNIPVAALRTSPATVFSMVCHFDLFKQYGHFPVDLSEHGHELENYIPGVPPIRLADVPAVFSGNNPSFLRTLQENLPGLSKAQYLLANSVYELEAPVFDTLKENFSFPLFPVGPNIPYFELEDISSVNSNNGTDCIQYVAECTTYRISFICVNG